MVDVTAAIRDLLYEHDCVIVPEFGGFIGNYKPATIDNATHTFSPPVKAISFNRNLDSNDGLLIGRISAIHGLGYVDARSAVASFVYKIRKRLTKEDRVEFEGIGYFRNNSEGNPVFEPDPDANFLRESFGLTSFRREPVQDFSTSSSILESKSGEGPRAVLRKMAWRAAIAVPIIALMIYVPLKTDLFKANAGMNLLANTEFEEHRDNVKEQHDSGEITEGIVPVETVNSGEVGESEVTTDLEPVETVAPISYYLIAGSFKEKANAERLINDSAMHGYKAQVISAPNGYYRVAISVYTNYDAALAEKSTISNDYPDTWILRQE